MIIFHRHPFPFHPNGETTEVNPCQTKYRSRFARPYHCARPSSAQDKQSDSANTKPKTFLKLPVHREETESRAIISLDVSGFKPSQLEIKVEEHVLSLHGERENRLGDQIVIHRRFALKENVYDEDTIEADLSDDILEISLHKKQGPAVRVIPVFSKRDENQEEEELAVLDEDSDDGGKIAIEEANENLDVTGDSKQSVVDDEEDTCHTRNTTDEEALTGVGGSAASEETTATLVETVAEDEQGDYEEQHEGASVAATAKSSDDEAWEEVAH